LVHRVALSVLIGGIIKRVLSGPSVRPSVRLSVPCPAGTLAIGKSVSVTELGSRSGQTVGRTDKTSDAAYQDPRKFWNLNLEILDVNSPLEKNGVVSG